MKLINQNKRQRNRDSATIKRYSNVCNNSNCTLYLVHKKTTSLVSWCKTHFDRQVPLVIHRIKPKINEEKKQRTNNQRVETFLYESAPATCSKRYNETNSLIRNPTKTAIWGVSPAYNLRCVAHVQQ